MACSVKGKIDAIIPPTAWINKLKTSHATKTKVYVRGFNQLISSPTMTTILPRQRYIAAAKNTGPNVRQTKYSKK